MNNSDKIILHLCATMGSDSMPYEEAGYDVRRIDKDIGVENYNPPENVYGIIANPPCTEFSIAMTTRIRDLEKGMFLVKHCQRIIWQCQYKHNCRRISPLKFWCIENPATGFLKWFLGNPVFTYNHYEYGENISKKTALWGMFNLPHKPLLCNPILSNRSVKDIYTPMNCRNNEERMNLRSLCPIKFAQAFYEANK